MTNHSRFHWTLDLVFCLQYFLFTHIWIDFRVQGQLLFKWKCFGKAIIKPLVYQTQYLWYRLFQTNEHPSKRQNQMLAVSEHTEEKDSSQHHSITTMSQKHGYTNSYSLKSNGNFNSKVLDLIPRGVCQKTGRKKCFFYF